MITNEEAIKILKVWLFKGIDGMTDERLGYLEGWFHKEDEEAFNMAIEALKQEPKTGWIPCSERLPEETGTYITTLDYEEHGLAVGQRYYHGEQIGWAEDDCVIAWMPLPKPYKAESEDKE